MRLVKLAVGAVLAAVLIWVDAVLHTPEVKRRKALRRRSRVLPKS
jgi:hypothetical protein